MSDGRVEAVVPDVSSLRGAWERACGSLGVIWCVALVPHVVALVAAVVSVARGHKAGNLVDFLGASRQMLSGADIYAGGTGGYVYPPLIAFLYQPLAVMPERWAAFVMLGVNAGLSVFTLVLVSRVLVRRLVGSGDAYLVARVALVGAWLTFDKIRAEFYHVETNVLMLLAFTAAMRWVDRRPWLCGMALGFGFNVKYWPVVLVPYLLARGRWRAVGWFAVWAVGFAVLPAVSMGWGGNARAWGEASGGLLKLFGVDVGVAGAAHLRPVTDAVSVSVTSGLARVMGCSAAGALVMAAGIGAVFCAYAAGVYVWNGVPLVRWPAVGRQGGEPFRGLLTVEWMGVLLLMLIFGPFTNSRHLYMLLDVNIAAGVLLLGTRGMVARGPLVVGATVLFLGITVPWDSVVPGRHVHHFWQVVGGPGWCMLGMYAAMIWTNVRYQRVAAGVTDDLYYSDRIG